MSVEALADKIGVYSDVVARWENAEKFPRIPSLVRITEALDITIGDLFLEVDIQARRRAESVVVGFASDYRLLTGFLSSAGPKELSVWRAMMTDVFKIEESPPLRIKAPK